MTALLIFWTVMCALSVLGAQVSGNRGYIAFWSILLVVHVVVLIGVFT